MKFAIYQMKNEHPEKFRDTGKRFLERVNYNLVYAGDVEWDGNHKSIPFILEKLFFTFNMEHPEGFSGHSLSVSDIVHLQPYSEVGQYYFCASAGWRRVMFR